MKKTILIIVMTAGVFACSKKIVPATDTPLTADEAAAKEKSAVAPNAGTDADATTGTKPPASEAAAVDIVQVGKTVYDLKCGKCHALKDPANYTATKWDNILQTMIPNAKLNSAEANAVTAYVKAHAKN